MPPVIHIKQSGLELDTLIFTTGEESSFQLELEDESQISSYKVHITFDEDDAEYSCELTPVWSYLFIQELESDENLITVDVSLPDSIRGFYSLKVEAFDEVGNLETEERKIEITNLSRPLVTSLEMDSVLSSCRFFVGSGIEPELNITASTSNLINEVLFYSYDDGVYTPLASYSGFSESQLNVDLTLNLDPPQAQVDTVMVQLLTEDLVSSWSRLLVEYE